MNYLEQSFKLKFNYNVYFTSDIFHVCNNDFAGFLKGHAEPGARQKILFVIDDGVLHAHPGVPDKIKAYFNIHNSVSFLEKILVIPGGESAKNDAQSFDAIIETTNRY